ncbi:MAG: glyoxylate/hydroxypyruvate reductase A [Burkholderiaceae bacterium]
MSIKIVIAANSPEATRKWHERFLWAQPAAKFIEWAEGQDPADADYAIVWRPPGALFHRERRLKAVFNLGAGVDSVMRLPELPADLPVVRLEDAGMAQQMAEYVLHGIAHASRGFADYADLQQAGQWRQLPPICYGDWPVGVMGLGAIGGQVAQAVARAGYPTAGWSRSARHMDGVQAFGGVGQLGDFLERSRVLVNVLPLTPDTENILNRRNLQRLRPGGYVINVARGPHVVDEDLLALIDEGHLRGALLDVFRVEPLPSDHPYWRHPKVRVTPHVAAVTLEDETVGQVLRKIELLQQGRTISGVVSRSQGY